MAKTETPPGKPMRFSVTARMRWSSSLHATRLTAVGNSHVYRHSPVLTFHSFIMLSAEPVTSRVEVAARAREEEERGSAVGPRLVSQARNRLRALPARS